MSRLRLFCSYASMAAILALAGWMVFVSFPLEGQAEVRHAATQAQARAPQTPPGYVVNLNAVSYPPEAAQKRIEGQVGVESLQPEVDLWGLTRVEPTRPEAVATLPILLSW